MRSFGNTGGVRPLRDRAIQDQIVQDARRAGQVVITDSVTVKQLEGTQPSHFVRFRREIEENIRRRVPVYREDFIPEVIKLAITRKLEWSSEGRSLLHKYGPLKSWTNETWFAHVPGFFGITGVEPEVALIASAKQLRFKMSTEQSDCYKLERDLRHLLHQHGYLSSLDDFDEIDKLPEQCRKTVQKTLIKNLPLGEGPPGAIKSIATAMATYDRYGTSFVRFFTDLNGIIEETRGKVEWMETYVSEANSGQGKKKRSSQSSGESDQSKSNKRNKSESCTVDSKNQCTGCGKIHPGGWEKCYKGPHGVVMKERKKPHPDFNYQKKVPFLSSDKGKKYAEIGEKFIINDKVYDSATNTLKHYDENDSSFGSAKGRHKTFAAEQKKKRFEKKAKRAEFKEDTGESYSLLSSAVTNSEGLQPVTVYRGRVGLGSFNALLDTGSDVNLISGEVGDAVPTF